MLLSDLKKAFLVAVGIGWLLVGLHLLAVHLFYVKIWDLQSFVLDFVAGVVIGLVVFAAFVICRKKAKNALTDREKELVDANAKLRQEIEERKRAEEQLGQSQKMEAIGRLAGGVAHDVNNVLASIMTVASAMKLDMANGQHIHPQEDIEDILEACKRGRDLTLSLLGFARKGDWSKRPLSMIAAVKDVKKLLERVAPKTIDLVIDIEPGVPQIEGDPSQIKNVLMNLCINGIDAMNDVGCLRMNLSNKFFKEPMHGLASGSYVLLEVSDTGEGMSEETIERAFDPFFTTKPEGKGTGLGLSRVWGTVVEHGGTVLIDSVPKKGTTITVYLPALGLAEQDPGIKVSKPPVPAVESVGILLVDDEALIRKSGQRLLEKLGYRVFTATDGANAIEIYRANMEQISIVLLDMMMPVLDGTGAFWGIREITPKIPVILCSGYSKDHSVNTLLKEKNVGFVQKPFSPGDLSEQMSEMLSNSN